MSFRHFQWTVRGGIASSLVLVVAIVLALGGGCSTQDAGQKHLNKAVEFISAGKLKAGVIELKNALSVDPQLLEARIMLARVALQLGDAASARKEVTRAKDLGLADAQAQPVLVRALFLGREYQEVLEETENLAGGMGEIDRVEAISFRARAMLRTGLTSEAQDLLDSLQHTQQSVSPWVLLAKAEAAMGRRQFDEARKLLAAAVQIDPEFADGWSLIGNLDVIGNNLVDAEKAYGESIKARPYLSDDTAKRALVRVRLGQFGSAEKDLDRLESAGFQENPFVQYVRGLKAFKQEDYDVAIEAFSSSLRGEPSSVNAMTYLATAHLAQGNTEQARTLADQAYYSSPSSTTAGRVLGISLMHQGDFDSAASILSAALEKSPEDKILLRMLGAVELRSGRAEQSIPYFERWLKLDPASDYAKEMLFRARFAAGQVGEDDFRQVDIPPSEDGFPVEDLLRAANAMRQNDMATAFEIAEGLATDFPDRVEPLNLLAAVYLASGQWDQGKAQLKKALQVDPRNFTANRNLAAVLAGEGATEDAIELLKPLVVDNPTRDSAILLLAELQSKSGDNPAALATLEHAARSDPDNSQLRFPLTKAYFDARRYADVIDMGVSLNDEERANSPMMLELLGKAYVLVGDLPNARATFESLVSIKPNSAGARYLLADTLARAGAIEAAQAELARALRLQPGLLPARLTEVRLLVARGQVKEAEQELGDLALEFPQNTDVLKLRGWFALGAVRLAQAESFLNSVLDTRPDSEAALMLVKAIWYQGKHDEAIGFMQRWLTNNPQDLAMRIYLAGAYLGLSQNDQAKSAYREVLSQAPNHVASLNNLAWLHRETDPQLALEYAEQAHQLQPNSPDVKDTLGSLLVSAGDWVRGLALLREAADSAPQNFEIQLHLGQALIKRGKPDEARKVLDRILQGEASEDLKREASGLLARHAAEE